MFLRLQPIYFKGSITIIWVTDQAALYISQGSWILDKLFLINFAFLWTKTHQSSEKHKERMQAWGQFLKGLPKTQNPESGIWKNNNYNNKKN